MKKGLKGFDKFLYEKPYFLEFLFYTVIMTFVFAIIYFVDGTKSFHINNPKSIIKQSQEVDELTFWVNYLILYLLSILMMWFGVIEHKVVKNSQNSIKWMCGFELTRIFLTAVAIIFHILYGSKIEHNNILILFRIYNVTTLLIDLVFFIYILFSFAGVGANVLDINLFLFNRYIADEMQVLRLLSMCIYFPFIAYISTAYSISRRVKFDIRFITSFVLFLAFLAILVVILIISRYRKFSKFANDYSQRIIPEDSVFIALNSFGGIKILNYFTNDIKINFRTLLNRLTHQWKNTYFIDEYILELIQSGKLNVNINKVGIVSIIYSVYIKRFLNTYESQISEELDIFKHSVESIYIVYGDVKKYISIFELKKMEHPRLSIRVVNEDEVLKLDTIIYDETVNMVRNMVSFNETNGIINRIFSKMNLYPELAWLLKHLRINQTILELYYATEKIIEYLIHWVSLITIKIAINNHYIDSSYVIDTISRSASLGSIEDFACELIEKYSIDETAAWWLNELDQNKKELLKNFENIFSFQTRSKKMRMKHFHDSVVAIRNKTLGHGVMPYRIVSSILLTFLNVLEFYLNEYISLSLNYKKIDHISFLINEKLQISLDDILIIDSDDIYLLNGYFSSSAEYINYGNGNILCPTSYLLLDEEI